jgi:pimeloyl-ACP methyl ester carboxylesterase
MKKIIILSVFILFAGYVLALNPSREYKVLPDKFGMKYKEELIPTSDGAKINTWYFECPKKVNNNIIISGSGDGNMADNLELINSFLSAGYNVLAYDYRGYGKSSDFTIEPDVYIYPQFITDLTTVMDHLKKLRASSKFDLYGINIGAGLSLGVGANRLETRRIIADGPWISLEAMKTKIKTVQGKDIVLPFGFDKNYEPVYGLETPKTKIQNILIFVSPKDELISPADLKPLLSAKGVKSVIEIFQVKKSPSNSQNFSTDKNAYFEKINELIAK